MTKRRKLGIISLILVFGVVCGSILYEPYSPGKIKIAMLKIQSCDKEAIAYLGDYYEKRGLEKEILELVQLSNKCYLSAVRP